MTKKEMLKKLSGLRYNLIWPDSSWEDVGFTERPIWINNKGWGYISCDEPCDFGEIEAISDDKWKNIREKLQKNKLKLIDLKETSLEQLFIDYYEYYDEEDDIDENDGYTGLNSKLKSLLSLPNQLGEHIYWADTFDGFDFFISEEEMYKSIDYRDCDQNWKDLDDKMLAVWIERISSELGDVFNK